MDDEVRSPREPLDGRFSSPFDPPEGRSGDPHEVERLELLRCDPFESHSPAGERPAEHSD